MAVCLAPSTGRRQAGFDRVCVGLFFRIFTRLLKIVFAAYGSALSSSVGGIIIDTTAIISIELTAKASSSDHFWWISVDGFRKVTLYKSFV